MDYINDDIPEPFNRFADEEDEKDVKTISPDACAPGNNADMLFIIIVFMLFYK